MASLAGPSSPPHTVLRVPAGLVVALSALGAGIALAFANGISAALDHHAGRLLAFLGATILLQFFSLSVPGRGSVGVSAIGLVGAAIAIATGPAMAIGVVAAVTQWARSRGLAHRALFDAANFALSAGAAGAVFHAIAGHGESGVQLLGALCAGLAYTATNNGLLCLAMGASESRSPLSVWYERYHWARFHFLGFGALGLLAATADAQLGAGALVAFVVPPIVLAHSMRSSLTRLTSAQT